MHIYQPYFKIGDFVKCSYDRFPYIYEWYEDEEIEYEAFYGVVVYVDTNHHEYLDEFIYEVLCLDGQKRYFIEPELSRM